MSDFCPLMPWWCLLVAVQIATQATRHLKVVGNLLFWAGMGLGQSIMTLLVS